YCARQGYDYPFTY
nr:immunoglobulin heavy chain junction region [Mus musculus]